MARAQPGPATPPVVYTEEWYDALQAPTARSASVLLEHFFSVYRPSSMVDVGAGTGTFLAIAKQKGVDKVLGVEGGWLRGKHDPSIDYLYQDLEMRLSVPDTYDTVLCLEVAEHLSPERADSFVEDLCRISSGLVIFGAAMPFQGGIRHLNEQDPTYWLDRFSRQGYVCHDFFRPYLWENSQVLPWHAQNTFLYIRNDDSRRALFSQPPLLNVYHPRYVFNTGVMARYNLRTEELVGARAALRVILHRIKQIASRPFGR